MSDIVITEFMDVAAIETLRQRFDVVSDPTLVDDPARLRDLLADARALIVRNRTKVSSSLLEASPGLLCVGRLGVGLDNIDLDACKTRGIAVFPATGANSRSVAEYVVTTAAILLRGAYQARDAMLKGEWPRQACSGREAAGMTLGLVGFGEIARQTASLAQGFGMRVAAFDPYLAADDPAWHGDTRRCDSLEALLRSADVLSLHVPLVPETRHLINAGTLAMMRPGAILINAARGGVVNDAEAAESLRRGHLGGLALDVYETEPLTEAAATVFADLPNVILTPHVAGVTEQSNQRVSALIASRVADHLVQHDASRVNP
ncbi:hydroxyacid dehydrogenase [Frigidibacter sp. ROC022]|uniref:hydroxyacid dehydrogenase n=1 Tax=Frigidibacter sp. ROC022 TaxID=2971796 RepID=UPI00215B0419|nr:hydroxyacid dehydrogenase [Frigidibacter sp. ROC022]MCR8724661.1 hydroxyacid dehydrogenase [Frigidibacter sp. ROC022]